MRLNPVFSSLPTTVFEQMSGLARAHQAINLGQGFPDGDEPQALLQAAAKALERGNQYAPSRGVTELRSAVADFYRAHDGLALTDQNVIITSGATEGLCAALLAVVSTGDEVIIIEPAYDAYRPLIERAGGVVKVVSLSPPHWRIERDLLDQAVTERTRAIVFNNPHNPVGRAFTEDEVEAVASLCRDRDLIAITDEVWERLVFDGRKHIALSTRPGMAERTLKVGSAGKLFGLTGWKIGFLVGEGPLLEAAAKAHQFITFTSAPNLQYAVAEGLAWPHAYFDDQAERFARSRTVLARLLEHQGYVVLASEATYFLCVDLAASGIDMPAAQFAEWAVKHHGIAGIPVSAFMSGSAGNAILRLCFAKPDEVLQRAAQRLGEARRDFLGPVPA
jgi:N-succinyldiaminopimelate aminotransferase